MWKHCDDQMNMTQRLYTYIEPKASLKEPFVTHSLHRVTQNEFYLSRLFVIRSDIRSNIQSDIQSTYLNLFTTFQVFPFSSLFSGLIQVWFLAVLATINIE